MSERWVAYFYDNTEMWLLQHDDVHRIVEEDTGADDWAAQDSTPPIGYPPPLSTEVIEKLKRLDGVLVKYVDDDGRVWDIPI